MSPAVQVSHHPPMLAMHVEGKGWTSWSEFAISSKFRGKYLQVRQTAKVKQWVTAGNSVCVRVCMCVCVCSRRRS